MSDIPPIVLTFAATDPSCGAGMQADILTIASMGCHPLSVITAITVQDSSGVDDVQTGMQFGVHSSTGEQIVTVTKVDSNSVTVDANHPLAGKTLNFEVKVVGVREPTPDELDHDHVHGPGGHR